MNNDGKADGYEPQLAFYLVSHAEADSHGLPSKPSLRERRYRQPPQP